MPLYLTLSTKNESLAYPNSPFDPAKSAFNPLATSAMSSLYARPYTPRASGGSTTAYSGREPLSASVSFSAMLAFPARSRSNGVFLHLVLGMQMGMVSEHPSRCAFLAFTSSKSAPHNGHRLHTLFRKCRCHESIRASSVQDLPLHG